MTLKEAVDICRKHANGRIPVSGYETEHFFVFTSLACLYYDPMGGSPMFAIDKETGQTGFLPSYILVLCSEGVESGWDQFRKYDSDELIRDTETDEEFRKELKSYVQ